MRLTLSLVVVLGVACVDVVARRQEARPTARDLAVRLAANRIAAGVVAPEEEFVPRGPRPRQDPRGVQAFREELPLILKDFGRVNPTLTTEFNGRRVFVASSKQPATVRELLAKGITVETTGQSTPQDAIFRLIASALQASPVTGLAGIGAVPSPDCPLNAPITLPRGTQSVRTILDAIVDQAPGVVWALTYEGDGAGAAVRLGVVCPDGVALRMPILK